MGLFVFLIQKWGICVPNSKMGYLSSDSKHAVFVFLIQNLGIFFLIQKQGTCVSNPKMMYLCSKFKNGVLKFLIQKLGYLCS